MSGENPQASSGLSGPADNNGGLPPTPGNPPATASDAPTMSEEFDTIIRNAEREVADNNTAERRTRGTDLEETRHRTGAGLVYTRDVHRIVDERVARLRSGAPAR